VKISHSLKSSVELRFSVCLTAQMLNLRWLIWKCRKDNTNMPLTIQSYHRSTNTTHSIIYCWPVSVLNYNLPIQRRFSEFPSSTHFLVIKLLLLKRQMLPSHSTWKRVSQVDWLIRMFNPKFQLRSQPSSSMKDIHQFTPWLLKIAEINPPWNLLNFHI